MEILLFCVVVTDNRLARLDRMLEGGHPLSPIEHVCASELDRARDLDSDQIVRSGDLHALAQQPVDRAGLNGAGGEGVRGAVLLSMMSLELHPLPLQPLAQGEVRWALCLWIDRGPKA